MPMPMTFPFPAMRAKNSNHSISSSTVGMGHATTSRRKLLVFRAGACIIKMPDGIDAFLDAAGGVKHIVQVSSSAVDQPDAATNSIALRHKAVEDKLLASGLPVTVPGKQPATIDLDEGPRADTSLEKLAKLKAAFREGGSVTAGNSSGLNDGAAAILFASARKAAELGLAPLARIVSAASAGVDPREMGMGPVPATHKALKKAGLSVKQLDLVELNEAFAAQSLAVIQELGLDPEKVNVDGGAIALGHPLGMSGARILGHLVHALKARGGKYGLATLCVGVGQGVSVIVESV